MTYDPFNPVGFGGQYGYYHDYQGRYLLTHRYYDPGNGRFVTRDPIGYGGGINLYGYVGNDPGNRWDPSGYNGIVIIIVIVIVVLTYPIWGKVFLPHPPAPAKGSCPMPFSPSPNGSGGVGYGGGPGPNGPGGLYPGASGSPTYVNPNDPNGSPVNMMSE